MSAPATEGHFCLLARWVSATDPITGEGADITANVRNSNNIVWRNLEGSRLLITDPDGAVLENIGVLREGTARLELQRTRSTPPRTFHVEATQLMTRAGRPPVVVGGVTYELTPPEAPRGKP